MEILSRLGQQGDRGSRIDKITDLDHMLPLALRALFRRNRTHIFEIHLDLFQWLAQFVWFGRLVWTWHPAAPVVPDRSPFFSSSGSQVRVIPSPLPLTPQ